MGMSKLTPKQIAFATEYVKTGNASEAYRIAYDCEGSSDKTIWEEASKLKNDPKVSTRIKILQDKAAERNKVTIDEITADLRLAGQMAKEDRAIGELTKAANSLAKLHGLIVEQSKNDDSLTITIKKEGIDL